MTTSFPVAIFVFICDEQNKIDSFIHTSLCFFLQQIDTQTFSLTCVDPEQASYL